MPGSSLIGNLAVLLSMDTSAFERGATQAQRLMARTQRQFQQLGEHITHVGIGLSAAITAPFAELMREAIPAAVEVRDALGQVEAALHSMGPVAGRTTGQLEEAAHALEHMSLFHTDDILRNVTANLLTFGRVAGENFDRAQIAAVNMATRLHQDLQPATIMIGRALNDPIRGLTALRRVGVAFTAEQEAMIRGFVAQNDLAAAQGVILRELEREFGGAAAAARAARPDAEMRQAWHEFHEVVGAIALRVLPPLTRALTGLLETFNQLSPRTQEIAVGAAAFAAAIGPVLLVVGPMVSLFGRLLPFLVSLAPAMTEAAAAAGGFGAAAGVLLRFLGPIGIAVSAVVLAWQNWDTIAPMVQQLGEALNAALGPAILEAVNAVSQALSALWSGPFGQALADVGRGLVQLAGLLASVFGPGVIVMLRVYVAAFAGIITLIADALNLVVALLSGNWSGAWTAAKALVMDAVRGIGRILEAIVPGAVAMLQRLYEGARDWLIGALGRALEWVGQKLHWVAEQFRWLYNVVVGHSYIPDMVDEIGRQMHRLDDELVRPAADATAAAGARFQALSELLDRLFPENRRTIQLQADINVIRGSDLSPEAQSSAIHRLLLQNGAVDPANVTPIPDQINETAEAYGRLSEIGMEAMSRLRGATEELGRSINDSIASGLKGLMRGFGSLKEIALNVLYAIGDALIDNLMSRIGSGQGSGGGIGGAIASLFSQVIQHRAMGGPVIAGQGYLVGERGPEWFTPSRSGTIVPNSGLGGARVTIVPSPYFDAVVDGRAVGVATPLSQVAAKAGSAGALNAFAYRRSRQLPTGF